MAARRGLTCFAIVAMFGLCAVAHGQDTAYSAAPGTDFAKYKTYAWADNALSAEVDPSIDARIRQAVDSQLAAKRLTRTEGPADLLVVYSITAQPERETLQGGSDMGVGNGSSIRYTTASTPTDAITVGLYDRAAKRFVWRGGATMPAHQKRPKDVDAIVGTLLKHYPPPEK